MSISAAHFRAIDPATGVVFGPEYATASLEDVDRAAEAASAAFRTYGTSTPAVRARLLRRIAAGIAQLGDLLIETAGAESALPKMRLVNERIRTCTQLRLFADFAEENSWIDLRVDAADFARTPPKPEVRSQLKPIGPVAVFGASNFPLAFSVAGGDTAAALAVGCSVVVKAHPSHPGTSKLVGRVIHDAVAELKLPSGVFDLLFDSGHDVGLALVRHRLIKAGAFTGSRRGGMALWRAAQSRHEPIPFFAEMSSVNPVFLFPSALTDPVAAGIHASMTLGVGQFCTQPGLIFVSQNDRTEDFLLALADRVSNTPAGTMLTPTICEDYTRNLDQRERVPGVRIVARVAAASGAALLVTDAKTFVETELLQEEIFGPATLAVICPSVEDFATCGQALEGQLTATVWGTTEELRERSEFLFMLEQKAGRIVFNGLPTGVEVGSAMVHGGPFPATTDGRFSSVGTRSIQRFVRPIAWQTSIGAS